MVNLDQRTIALFSASALAKGDDPRCFSTHRNTVDRHHLANLYFPTLFVSNEETGRGSTEREEDNV